MLTFDLPSILVAFLVTVLEMTEVVALVFAIGADHATVRHVALGATAGTAAVSLTAVAAGAVLIALPRGLLLWASAAVLAGFGVFLFRSTLRTYRKLRVPAPASPSGKTAHSVTQFAGGFSVGAVEATEAVIVLLALTAAGHGGSAIVGAVAGGVLLAVVAALVHERVRRIKTAWLKLGATSLVLAFAVFWAGEAYGLAWPGPSPDLWLVPLFVAGFLLVRGAIAGLLRPVRTVPRA